MTKFPSLPFFFSVLLALTVASTDVSAESFPPIKNSVVKTECGECHMAFFAEMLPRKSWLKILNNLTDHYGEDASVDPDLLKDIITHHITRASDVLNTRGARKWREGIDRTKGEAPERITTAPRYIRKHDDDDFKEMWEKYNVTSKADCVACHKDADKGLFDDD